MPVIGKSTDPAPHPEELAKVVQDPEEPPPPVVQSDCWAFFDISGPYFTIKLHHFVLLSVVGQGRSLHLFVRGCRDVITWSDPCFSLPVEVFLSESFRLRAAGLIKFLVNDEFKCAG